MKLEITESETHKCDPQGYCAQCGVKWETGAKHTTTRGKVFVQPKYDPLNTGLRL